MAVIDIDTFTKHLRDHAFPAFGQRQCATKVREALEAAGGNTKGHPRHAKDWGPTLVRGGFRIVPVEQLALYSPMKGDIAVIQATSSSASGHIQGYDGKQWISDFVQTAFWPGPAYRNETPSFVIYRP